MNENIIELEGIAKKFGSFYANKNISLQIRRGSIHAIVGENGAGKSTLMNILYGMYEPDAGTIKVCGEMVNFTSPTHAIRHGIGMVHQHFMLIPTLSVAENIVLGQEPTEHGVQIPFREVESQIKVLAKQFGLEIEPTAKVGTLSVGLEQRVEILKVLYRKADILILDEPTAVLTPLEIQQFFGTLRSLREGGKTIIIITHKLEEVLAISDSVSVMRQGQLIATLPTAETDKAMLAKMMVGRDVLLRVEKTPSEPNGTILSVQSISYKNAKGISVLENLSFEVQAGEVYGIAGVEGNGQSALLSLLWGLLDEPHRISGEVLFCGKSLLGKSPREIARLGISHIPEDRHKHAMIKAFSIAENLVFGRQHEREFLSAVGFNTKKLASYAAEMIRAFDVRVGEKQAAEKIGNLSGGNQQKVVVAREINRPELKLLILAQPTRGIDIGAIEFIHQKVIEARDKGIAVLLISAELEEILSLSDRIGCLFKGKISHEFSREAVLQGRKSPENFEKEIGYYIT
ncbi:ABC transporter-related protein [Chloroherpeton thalassium ATCC 35110]|uniref:ABC transporter-related protein n=1 Tax=Chloroherpeton thalassium (strain ATCC 35110 / GB-78) TaxID=517418 RepID=B3QRP7_CHLT3|nr:ABC transporter ATP-binding protein [Chloroherpeton thalassium]ACF13850.1 ABC transporter-related protein [Chloroherpeton thalassium ATCC 35110]